MKIEESHRRQAELEDRLKEMAAQTMDDDALRAMAMELKALYADGFRHNYSKFYPLIVEIFDESNEYNADFLSENLEQIRGIVEKDYFEVEEERRQFIGLYKPLTKLADHISLEIGRHNQSLIRESRLKDLERKNEELQNALTNAKEALDSANNTLSDNIEQTNESLKKTNNQLQSAQREYVAILGIFAAAVLAFTGGIAFSTSVLENIASASIYRTIGVALVVGIVLINVLFTLFYHIERIVHGSGKVLVPMLVSNVVLVCLLILTFCSWKNGTVEIRNRDVEQIVTETAEVTEYPMIELP